MALGVMLALTISVTAMVQLSSANARGASLSLADQGASSIAEDGFNRAVSVVAASPTSSAPFTGSLGGYPHGGSVTWSGTRSGDTWSVSATATVSNPTGPGASAVSRTVQAELEVSTDPGAWNFVYVRPTPGTCLLFKNAFRMDAPMYVDGNFCLSNEATYRGPRLYVKGTVQTEHTSSIGTLLARVPVVSVKNNAPAASGCRYLSFGSFLLPCTALQRVFTDDFNTTVPDITKPPVYMDERYAEAAPGSTTRGHSCISSNLSAVSSRITSNTLDNNMLRDSSLGAIDLLPAVSYSCTIRAADGTVVGSLAWTYGNPGTLTVSGTVFLDGDIIPSQNRHAVVNGEGTIYANNKIVIQNDTTICGVADCGSSWNPNMEPPHLLFFVAGYSGHPAIELQSYGAKFQGGLYAVGGVKIRNGASMHGPLIADELDAENSADFDPWPWFTDIPDGAPSNGETTLKLKEGSWRG